MTTSVSFDRQVDKIQDAADDIFSYHARRVATFDCKNHRQDGDPPCRRFNCRSCGKTMLAARQAEMLGAAKRCNAKTHVVLTAPAHATASKESARLMRKKLLRLRQAYQRKFGKRLNGIWVLSLENARLHFHLIVDADVSPWFREKWRQLTGAFEVHQRSIYEINGMVGYMLKNYLCVTSHCIGRRVGGFGSAKLKFSRTNRSLDAFENAEDAALLKQLESQLFAANELPSTRRRGGRLWPYPPFRKAKYAARNLVREFARLDHWLVMPWPNLAPLRAELLKAGKIVIVPKKDGGGALRMIYDERGIPVFAPYKGPADCAVISCTAFSPHSPQIYALDCDSQASLLENVQEPEAGLHFNYKPPIIVCLASDGQQIQMQRRHRGIPTHLVFTPTRIIPLDPELKRTVEHEETDSEQ